MLLPRSTEIKITINLRWVNKTQERLKEEKENSIKKLNNELNSKIKEAKNTEKGKYNNNYYSERREHYTLKAIG